MDFCLYQSHEKLGLNELVEFQLLFFRERFFAFLAKEVSSPSLERLRGSVFQQLLVRRTRGEQVRKLGEDIWRGLNRRHPVLLSQTRSWYATGSLLNEDAQSRRDFLAHGRPARPS